MCGLECIRDLLSNRECLLKRECALLLLQDLADTLDIELPLVSSATKMSVASAI